MRWIWTYAEYQWRPETDDYELIRGEGYWWDGPVALAHTNAVLDQQDFRGRNDDGSEAAATWKATVNTNWTQAVDENFRVRFQIVDDAAGGENNVQMTLQYNLNGAGWNNVTGSSSVVQAVDSANLTDGEDTTQQIGTGTFITPNGGVDDLNGVVGESNEVDFADGVSDVVELEFSLQILSADVADADTVQLRVVRGDLTLLDNYTNTPSITVSEAAGGQTITVGLPVADDSALVLTSAKGAAVGQAVEGDVALALDIAATTVAFDAVSAVALASSTDTVSTSITIGSGTNRKLMVYVGNRGDVVSVISTLTFDPGGGDETAGSPVTGAQGSQPSNEAGEWGFIDIADGVASGTYTVEVFIDDPQTTVMIAVIALENAAAGQPTETTPVVTTGGTGTTISPTITPASDNNMIVEGFYIDDSQTTIGPDDGQTERFDDDAGTVGDHLAGSTNFVGTAAQTDAGWSWTSVDDFIHIAVAVPTAGAGAPVVVGQPAEDDTALPLAALKLVAAGQALGDDVAQALSALKTVQVGQAVEDDTALPVSVSKAQAVGQAAEDDSALSLGSAQTILVGLPVEDDSGQTLAVVKAQIVGIASEDDVAQPLGVLKVSAVGQPVSDDSALSANVVKLSQLSIAASTDTALPLTVGGSTQVGQADEDDSALPVTAAKAKSTGQAMEGDEALSLSAGKTIIAGLPTEADSAVAASAVKLVVLGLPSTDDVALSLGVFKAVSVGLPASTAEALPLAGGAVEAPVKQTITVAVESAVIQSKVLKVSDGKVINDRITGKTP